MDDDALTRRVLEATRSLFGIRDPSACEHHLLGITKFSLERGIEELTCQDCGKTGASFASFNIISSPQHGATPRPPHPIFPEED